MPSALSIIVVLDAHQGGRADAPTVEVSGFDSWQLDVEELERWLARVPVGKAYEARSSPWVLELPMPDGHTESFTVVNSPIMAPELAARFPEIQVYAGQGVESPGATVRFDLTPQGFHAMVMKEGETVFIDPYHPGERGSVICYTRVCVLCVNIQAIGRLHGP